MSTTMIKRNSILAGFISATCIVFPSASYSFSLSLAPTDFARDVSTGSGTVDTASAIGGALNNSTLENGVTRIRANQTGNGGFGNFFTSGTFLSLGGTGTTTIGSSPKLNNTRANSIGFLIDQDTIDKGLQVTFSYIFAGYIGNGATSSFDVQLLDTDSVGTSANSTNFITAVTLTNTIQPTSGSGTFLSSSGTGVTGIIDSATLLGAGYSAGSTLYLSLNVNEPSSSNSTNTVAGFQQISVSTVVPVPFEFDPSAGLLLLGAGFGLNKFRKSLKSKKSYQVK
jgi:hypothetical protein